MITKQVTTRDEIFALASFIQEVVLAMPPGHTFKETFTILLHNVESGELGVWVQYDDETPIAFASATINHTLTGERICYLWLVYGKPGANLRQPFFEQVLPWVIAQGAVKIQASDCTYSTAHHQAKDKWYTRFGMKKAFEVYERELKLC